MTRRKLVSNKRKEEEVPFQYKKMDGQAFIKIWDRPLKLLRK
jgi:hypothetical protein